MPKYLLDADIIEYLGDTSSPFHSRCLQKLGSLTGEDELCTSILTLYELEYSIAGASPELAPRLQQAKQKILDFYTILPLTHRGSELYGRLKVGYKRRTGAKPKAMKGHTVDMILAGTALAHQAVLVSNDRIFLELQWLEDELLLENWAEAP